MDGARRPALAVQQEPGHAAPGRGVRLPDDIAIKTRVQLAEELVQQVEVVDHEELAGACCSPRSQAPWDPEVQAARLSAAGGRLQDGRDRFLDGGVSISLFLFFSAFLAFLAFLSFLSRFPGLLSEKDATPGLGRMWLAGEVVGVGAVVVA